MGYPEVHMSRECNEPPWVFAAQVIQEDEDEVPHAPDAHEYEHEEQEAIPIPQENKEDTEYSLDPNGSDYESGNDEFPLDTFNEYIEVEGNDEDSNVVYIWASCCVSIGKQSIQAAETTGKQT
jgi:hypothetical protein